MRIAKAVGQALSYAHAQGVIHRDVKPSNVFLASGGRVVLTDFGLADVLDETRFTVDGATWGTPSYMAPEQAWGEAGDHRSDIYALGILLYQILAGERPFRSETLAGILRQHLDEPPPPLRTKVPDLPAPVAATIERMLAKQPEDRFQSVDDVLAAFEGAAVPEPAPASPSGSLRDGGTGSPGPPAAPDSPANPPSVRRRFAGAAAALLVVTLGWWMSIPSMTTEPTPSMVPVEAPAVPSMTPPTRWQDGFDDNRHDWELSSGPVVRSLVDGTYEIAVTVANQATSSHARAGGEFASLEFSSVGTLVEGQRKSGYGLVFRHRDDRNYYVFAVNGLGQWSLWVLEDGRWRELRGLADEWTSSGAIVTDGANRLSVRAVGPTMTVSANGVELITLQDDTLEKGHVGYYVASSRTAATARARVRFDDAEAIPLAADLGSAGATTPP